MKWFWIKWRDERVKKELERQEAAQAALVRRIERRKEITEHFRRAQDNLSAKIAADKFAARRRDRDAEASADLRDRYQAKRCRKGVPK